MDTKEEIVSRIKQKIKGKPFIKIPLWIQFADDIAFKNRFMQSETKTDVNNFLDSILKNDSMRFCISKGTILYRARIIDRKEISRDENGKYIGFSKKGSGMPPYRSAPYGRAGTSGIPVFYTATDSKTSCAEVRPIKGECISVAEYEVEEDLCVADFSLDNIRNFEGSPEGALFLKEMFTNFSIPVSSELIDYLPCEYIAEHIRVNHKEINGIRYSSLQNESGYNVALFSEKQCRYLKSSVVECSVSYSFQDINDIY